MAEESHTVEMIATLLGVAFFVVMGVVVLVSGVKEVWWAVASSRWPRVAAEVVRSWMTRERSRNSDGTTGTLYTAQLRFAYEVDGQRYTTEHIRFGESLGSGDPSEPQMHRLRYPEGARVSVVHHPKDPAVAAARPGLRPSGLVPVVAGVALLMAAAMILLGARLALYDAPVFPVLLRLFVLVFLLMGGTMGVAGAINLYFSWASRGWPSVTGQVVFQEGDQVQSRWQDSEGRTQQTTTYSTSIVYSFPVNGITHYANTRRWGQIAAAGEAWAGQIAARYPVGTTVEVRYDPVDPDRAVLEPGFSSDVLWLPGAGLAFLLFGLAAWVWGIPALARSW